MSGFVFDSGNLPGFTVDRRATAAWLEQVQQVLGDRTPDYLIISHMEPDHAASIQVLAERYPSMQLVTNAKAFQMLSNFFDFDFSKRKLVVKEGDTLSLGTHTLQFILAPMVHWPEVMVTYEQSEKVLFSADGFGKFGTLDTEEDWDCEARRYYFNIVGKYGGPVQTLLKKASALELATICPLHGPVLTGDLSHYLKQYDTWSSYHPEDPGVLVAYASIHGNTADAAKKLAAMLQQKGVQQVVVMDLSRCDLAEAVEDAFRYDRMVVAAPTYDGGIFPVMEDFLRHLLSKNYQNRTVGIVENGSWAPVAGKKMKELLEAMKEIHIVEPMVTIRSAVKPETMQALETLADALV